MEGENKRYSPNQQPFDESGGIYEDFKRIYQESQEKLEKIEEDSLKDALTGCYNRKYWEKFASNFNPKTDRIAMVNIDIDGLKQINDGPGGHAAGDRYIKKTANFLKEIFKDHEDKIIRMGGDEFLVLSQKGKNNHESYVHFKDFINNALKEKKLEERDLSLSYGIAHFTLKADTIILDTYDRADKRMYSHKKAKKAKK